MTCMAISFSAQRVLMWLVQQDDDNDDEIPETVCDRDLQPAVYEELVGEDLLEADERLAGTSFGMSPAQRGRGRRLCMSYRDNLAQVRLMELLNEQLNVQEVAALAGTRWGEDFTGVITPDEANRAGSVLLDDHLIDATKTWGPDLLHPELTGAGRRALHSGLAPADYLAGGGARSIRETSYTNTFTAPVGVVQQGDHNTAHTTQHISDMGSLVEVLKQMHQVVARDQTADPAEREFLREQIELIAREANAGKNRTWVRAALNALVAGASTELGSRLATHLPAAIEAL